MDPNIKARIIDFHEKGWTNQRIAALFTIHEETIVEVLKGAEPVKKKTVDAVEEKQPKVSKISKK